MALSGSSLYIAGSFNTVGSQNTRYNIAAIDVSSGSPTSWAPNVDNEINALIVSGTTAFIGGSFDYIGGSLHMRIGAISTGTGNEDVPNPVGALKVRA
jgi:hypothetical protein